MTEKLYLLKSFFLFTFCKSRITWEEISSHLYLHQYILQLRVKARQDFNFVVFTWQTEFPLADPGGAAGARPPLRVQILSFWHTNFSKCSRLGSWRPPTRSARPLREILDPPLISVRIERKRELITQQETSVIGCNIILQGLRTRIEILVEASHTGMKYFHYPLLEWTFLSCMAPDMFRKVDVFSVVEHNGEFTVESGS